MFEEEESKEKANLKPIPLALDSKLLTVASTAPAAPYTAPAGRQTRRRRVL